MKSLFVVVGAVMAPGRSAVPIAAANIECVFMGTEQAGSARETCNCVFRRDMVAPAGAGRRARACGRCGSGSKPVHQHKPQARAYQEREGYAALVVDTVAKSL
jgi:hypothetical protein